MRWFTTGAAVVVSGMLAWAAEPVPDFSLRDTNSNSNREGGMVSPRDYLLQVSGYYFGAAG